ncbi:uncharacterized protein LOC131842458 [Achroia grisella]|uniref:uncharacterized protein LOC131842458 n=1 Tax=Achroia grisella TaxID=688607 RepID=UPI0027D2C2CE|nr:uncharacterized protein LOC131842458 [Achroia grisella]
MLQEEIIKEDFRPDDLRHADWSPILSANDIDSKVAAFQQLLLNVYDKHAPVQQVRLKYNPAPWLTPELKALMCRRDRARMRLRRNSDDSSRESYIALRNRCNRLCRQARRRHIHTNIEGCPSGKLWSYLRNLGIGKRHSGDFNFTNLNEINQAFAAAPGTLNPIIKQATVTFLADSLLINGDPFTLGEISVDELLKNLNSINSRAVGDDGIGLDMIEPYKTLLASLINNNINIENWDPLIIHIISNKLDSESQKTWEEELQTIPVEELPTLEKFKKYLEGRFRVTEMIQTSYMKERTQIKPKSFATITSNAVKRNTEYRSRNIECGKCKENHDIFSCKEFIKLDPVMRTEYIKKERLCFNCLRPGHSVKFCRYRMRCDICNRKHHTLIHITKPNLETINNETEEIRTPDNQTTSQHNILSHVSIRGRVSLLATALVNLETSRGPQIVRALIDPCSEESFISEAVVKRLQLKCKDVEGQVSAVGQMSTPFKHAAEIELSSRMNKNYKLKCTAYLIKHVTDIMPATRINYEHWTHFSGIELADPTYHTPGNVDLLLGVHVYTDILMSGVLKRNQGEPIAQQTYLGWIISGGEAVERLPNKGQIISMHLSVTLDNMLQRFWECESLESENKNTLTSQEARAEEIYEKTVMRDEQGRYVVSLPFVRDNPILPENSREIAMRRLRGLERRLAGNENLKREYDNVLKEYITLNHMELVKDEREKDTVYLPHHAVFRDDKTTSKVRVVFDARVEVQTELLAILRESSGLYRWWGLKETVRRDAAYMCRLSSMENF